MSKFLFYIAAIAFLTLSYSQAAVYKGQKVFIKKCSECHKNRQQFVSNKTTSEWETLFENNGKELVELHLSNKEAEDSWDYFNSSSFNKKKKHLLDFLLEYAKDSGHVPACN